MASGIPGPVRLLVVDDDVQLRDLLVLVLQREGYTVEVAGDASTALAAVAGGDVDLVVLDIGLGHDDGRAVLAQIRQRSDLPVIMISGHGEVVDRVLGLRLGADDYLPKPFSPVELSARIEAVLRRRRTEEGAGAGAGGADGAAAGGAGEAAAGPGAPAGADEAAPASPDLAGAGGLAGGLSIDEGTREVTVAGTAVQLTAREFNLLAFLVRSPRQVFTRSQLLEHVWSSRPDWQDEATVTEHIRRVRRKVEADPDHPRWITTVRGVGYRYEP